VRHEGRPPPAGYLRDPPSRLARVPRPCKKLFQLGNTQHTQEVPCRDGPEATEPPTEAPPSLRGAPPPGGRPPVHA